ncbi:MAG: NAD-glutamate dehydrogenase, partial [Desulfuromonadales bacterium]|nr:NAD-glutamate dehydrogenase [Desulfuromonadales bacterium]
MELIIEEGAKSLSDAHSARIADIQTQLRGMNVSEDADALLSLADSLFAYSHSHELLELPLDEFITWLQDFLDFLRLREAPVKVERFVPAGRQVNFLLLNTPDVPFLIESLKMLLQREQQRAEIVSHPIVNIERSEGLLQSLGCDDDSGFQESFMLLRVESDAQGCRHLAQAITDVFLVAQSAGCQKEALECQLKALAS